MYADGRKSIWDIIYGPELVFNFDAVSIDETLAASLCITIQRPKYDGDGNIVG